MTLAETPYSFLDTRLADLMLRICVASGLSLNEEQQQQLKALSCLASQSTRQGMIAAPLPEALSGQIDALLTLPVVGCGGDYKPLIIEHQHVWLNRYWQYEQRLAQNIAARLHTLEISAGQQDNIARTLDEWFPHPDTALQKLAVERAATTPFLIISGGPGTGKTTTVIRLLWLLVSQLNINPARILLAAPTGKAAMRLQEAIRQAKTDLKMETELAARIPEQGSTLHRLLGYIPGQTGFRHHAHNPLPAEVVIVDEASMIDLSLMTHLFEAVSPHARLILLGDKDQLASVETGSIYRDLCATPATRPMTLDKHIVVLEKSWRFAADSGIGRLAGSVRDRAEQTMLNLLHTPPADISWDENVVLEMSTLQAAWGAYIEAVNGFDPQASEQEQLKGLFRAFNGFRILTPLRKGPLGTEQLNQNISRLMMRLLSTRPQGQWHTGRPVMVTENDYRQGLFNGDIGLTLPDAEGRLRVWFADNATSGGFRAIATVRLPLHETAWAMTIHKSQGSEFDQVLLLLPEDEEAQILGRELLYTGITRARKHIGIMGRAEVLLAALKRSLPDTSCIRWRLAQDEPQV